MPCIKDELPDTTEKENLYSLSAIANSVGVSRQYLHRELKEELDRFKVDVDGRSFYSGDAISYMKKRRKKSSQEIRKDLLKRLNKDGLYSTEQISSATGYSKSTISKLKNDLKDFMVRNKHGIFYTSKAALYLLIRKKTAKRGRPPKQYNCDE